MSLKKTPVDGDLLLVPYRLVFVLFVRQVSASVKRFVASNGPSLSPPLVHGMFLSTRCTVCPIYGLMVSIVEARCVCVFVNLCI